MFAFLSKWKEKISTLIETRVQLIQLELIERVSKLMGMFVLILLMIILLFGVLLFIGFGVSEVFSYYTDSRIWGNFITAFLYLLLGLGVFALRKPLLRMMSSTFVNALTEDKEEEEKENRKASENIEK